MNTPFVTTLLTHIERSFIVSSAVERGEVLADVLRTLVEIEVAPGGPYACRPHETDDAADTGLNLIIALFLRSHGVSLPNLDAFIQKRLSETTLTSAIAGKKSLAELVRLYGTPRAPTVPDMPLSTREDQMLAAVREAATARLSMCTKELSRAGSRVIARTIDGNPDRQMSLMAWFLREALGSIGGQIPDRHIIELGVANIYFWTAFIIYDDFWDEDEAAEPLLLPVANLFARHYVDFFSRADQNETGFREFFHTTMDALDEANVWEMSACRMRVEGQIVYLPETIPDYGDYRIKFHPAAGHILGPVLMLVQLGYGISSAEVTEFISYAKHYLIAMQLNDDMHDWKEDLARGHISTAVASLLQAVVAQGAGRESIHLIDDMDMLERLFWFEVVPSLCVSVLTHTDAARSALAKLHFLEDPAPLEQFIARNERIAHEALGKQEETEAFLHQMKTGYPQN